MPVLSQMCTMGNFFNQLVIVLIHVALKLFQICIPKLESSTLYLPSCNICEDFHTVGELQDPAAAHLIFVAVAALDAEGCSRKVVSHSMNTATFFFFFCCEHSQLFTRSTYNAADPHQHTSLMCCKVLLLATLIFLTFKPSYENVLLPLWKCRPSQGPLNVLRSQSVDQILLPKGTWEHAYT